MARRFIPEFIRNRVSMTRPIGICERISSWATRWSGTSWAFILAVISVLIWALLGPYFHYSDTWQLVINTSTTIATFLMVFLIQRSQNKESLSIQLKLNELVAAIEGASNRLINVEDRSEAEIHNLHQRYQQMVSMVRRKTDERTAQSIDKIAKQNEPLTRPNSSNGEPAANSVAEMRRQMARHLRQASKHIRKIKALQRQLIRTVHMDPAVSAQPPM